MLARSPRVIGGISIERDLGAASPPIRVVDPRKGSSYRPDRGLRVAAPGRALREELIAREAVPVMIPAIWGTSAKPAAQESASLLGADAPLRSRNGWASRSATPGRPQECFRRMSRPRLGSRREDSASSSGGMALDRPWKRGLAQRQLSGSSSSASSSSRLARRRRGTSSISADRRRSSRWPLREMAGPPGVRARSGSGPIAIG